MNGRVSQFASALRGLGIDRGDVVSFMCPNLPPILEAHFAMPHFALNAHQGRGAIKIDMIEVIWYIANC